MNTSYIVITSPDSFPSGVFLPRHNLLNSVVSKSVKLKNEAFGASIRVAESEDEGRQKSVYAKT